MKGSPVLGADAARSRLTWAADAHAAALSTRCRLPRAAPSQSVLGLPDAAGGLCSGRGPWGRGRPGGVKNPFWAGEGLRGSPSRRRGACSPPSPLCWL